MSSHGNGVLQYNHDVRDVGESSHVGSAWGSFTDRTKLQSNKGRHEGGLSNLRFLFQDPNYEKESVTRV
jgi:hypothetical protein